MKRSITTPWGLLTFGGIDYARQIHASMTQLLGDRQRATPIGLSTAPGSLLDLASFGAATILAMAMRKLDRAEGQRSAGGVYDLIDDQEGEHGIAPSPGATIAERRATLKAHEKLAKGAARPNVESALRELLGSNFVGIHITQPDEAQLFPAMLGAQPMNLARAGIERKIIRIQQPICIGIGAPQTVYYSPFDPISSDGSSPLRIGDELVVEPEIAGRAEKITVTDVSANIFGHVFTAVFNNAHEPLAYATTMPLPMWMSTQREVIVVVSNAAALDVEKRRQVHDLLERMLSCVTVWALVQSSGAGTAGPFTLDDPVLGVCDANPLDLVTI